MSLLLNGTLKVSLVILLGLALARLLGRRSAAVRHWALSVTIAAALCTPIIERIVPAWGIRPGAFASASHSSSGRAPLAPEAVVERVEITEAMDATPARAQDGADVGYLVAPVWLTGVGLSLLLLIVGLGRLGWLASRAE